MLLPVQTTKQLHLSATVQARRFSLFGQTVQMPDENRCQDLNSFPCGELEEIARTPSYYVDEDYPVGTEIQ